MGNVEADFRGGDDVILTDAVNGMNDDQIKQAVEWLAKNDVFKQSGIADGAVKTKMDLLLNLDRFPSATKTQIVESLKAGENPFEDY